MDIGSHRGQQGQKRSDVAGSDVAVLPAPSPPSWSEAMRIIYRRPAANLGRSRAMTSSMAR